MLTTKYKHWEYEEEVRIIVRLEESIRDPEDDHYYVPFTNKIRLREVVTGPLFKSPLEDFRIDIGIDVSEVELIKSQLSFESFEVVPSCDRDGVSKVGRQEGRQTHDN